QGMKGGRNVAVYLDDTLRIEVGVEIHGPFRDSGDVVRSSTPAGTVATITHLGPYQALGTAYAALKDWAKANNYRLAGASWEVYGHWDSSWDKDPSKIRTDIFFSVQPA